MKNICKNCKFFAIADKFYNALSPKIGTCNNEKLMDSPNNTGNLQAKDKKFDFVIMSDCGCGSFHVGECFGCIHFTEK